MKKLILWNFCAFLLAFSSYSQIIDSVFISEFHYDNFGSDTLEIVEVSGISGTNLNCYTVYLYNGSNGLIYNQLQLDGVIPNQICELGAVSFSFSSIQNGPDAIALYNNCTNSKLQLLSYEGEFVVNDGPFSGDSTKQISVQEVNSTLEHSIQFLGPNTNFVDSLWIGPIENSFGYVNTLNSYCNFSVEIDSLLVKNNCQDFGLQDLSAIISNTSNSSLDSFIISYSFQDSIYVDSLYQNILPDSSIQYVFQDSILFLNEGDFTINCWIDALESGQVYSDTFNLQDSFVVSDTLNISDLYYSSCIGDTINLQAADFNAFSFQDTSFQNWSVIVNQDQDYQLTVYNECESDSFLVSVNVSELDLGEDIYFCNGDTFLIDAPLGFSSYNWSNGDSTSQVLLTETVNLNLIVEDTLGCILSDLIFVQQSSNIEIGNDSILCIGDTILIQPNFDNGFFQWSTGEISSFINCYSSSEIELIYTDSFDCISSDLIVVEFINCDTSSVSVLNKSDFNFSVYPNPTDQFLYISNLSSVNQSFTYYLFNSLGQSFVNKKEASDEVVIDIRNLPRGIYFLQIERDKKIESHKILIM